MTERDAVPHEMNQVLEVLNDDPMRWYESNTLLGNYARSLCIILLSAKVYEYFTEDQSMYAKIAALIAYTLGAIADNYSTIRSMRAYEELQNHGIDSGAVERNPIIGPVRTTREFMRSPRHWGMEVAGLSITTLSPGIGVGSAIARGYIAMENMRLAQRQERALEILKEQ